MEYAYSTDMQMGIESLFAENISMKNAEWQIVKILLINVYIVCQNYNLKNTWNHLNKDLGILLEYKELKFAC